MGVELSNGPIEDAADNSDTTDTNRIMYVSRLGTMLDLFGAFCALAVRFHDTAKILSLRLF